MCKCLNQLGQKLLLQTDTPFIVILGLRNVHLMRHFLIVTLTLISIQSQAQTLVGTWQLTDEKTCFQSEMKESDTEKELLKDMSSSSNGVARIIKFDKKGGGEEAVFSMGKKKGSNMSSFKYKINGKDLMLLDGKSGMMTQQLVVDELSQTVLKIHNAKKECETKAFLRIK